MKYIVINQDKIALFECESQYELFEKHEINIFSIKETDEFIIAFSDDEFTGQTLTEMNLSLDLNQTISDIISEKEDLLNLANMIMSDKYDGVSTYVYQTNGQKINNASMDIFKFEDLPDLKISKQWRSYFKKITKNVLNPELENIKSLKSYFSRDSDENLTCNDYDAYKFHESFLMRLLYPKLKTHPLVVEKEIVVWNNYANISAISFGKLESILTREETKQFQANLLKYEEIKANKEKEADRQNIQQKLNNVKK